MNGTRLLLASLFGVLLACALDDELENAECLSNADCWTNQECVQTPDQVTLGVPGLCRAKGSGCAQGEQLGCACAVDAGGQRSCSSDAGYLMASSQEANCVCVGEDPTTT